MWVVQEVMLSNSAVAICGSSSMRSERFVGLRSFRLRNYEPLVQLIEEMPFGDLLWLWDQLRSEIINGTATLFSIVTAMRKLQSID